MSTCLWGDFRCVLGFCIGLAFWGRGPGCGCVLQSIPAVGGVLIRAKLPSIPPSPFWHGLSSAPHVLLFRLFEPLEYVVLGVVDVLRRGL